MFDEARKGRRGTIMVDGLNQSMNSDKEDIE